VLSAAARALHKPEPESGKFYQWFYRFTHILLANWDLSRGKSKGKIES
jgi:hypothetical protein